MEALGNSESEFSLKEAIFTKALYRLIENTYGTMDDGVTFIVAISSDNEDGVVCNCEDCKGEIASRKITTISGSRDKLEGVQNLVLKVASKIGALDELNGIIRCK